MQIDSIIPFGQQKKTTPSPTPSPTPAPTPTPSPAPTPSPTPTPGVTPTPTPAPTPPASSADSGAAAQPVPVVQITTMRDAVRQAVIDARTPAATTRWIELPPALSLGSDIEEAIARSKADILAEAAQAMLAQANQTRESVTSLLQAPD